MHWLFICHKMSWMLLDADLAMQGVLPWPLLVVQWVRGVPGHMAKISSTAG